jgi:hypothetical protein
MKKLRERKQKKKRQENSLCEYAHLTASSHLRYSSFFMFLRLLFFMLSFILRPLKKRKKKEFEYSFETFFLLCSAFFSAFYIIYFAVKQHISFVIHFLFKLDFNTHINHKISSNKMAAMWKIIITIFVLTVIGRYDNLDLFLTYS